LWDMPFLCCLWHFLWDCHLWDCWWVFAFESLNYLFEGKNVISLFFEDGTLFSNQLVGLGDCRERVCDRLNVNLISVSVSPGPNPGSKSRKDDRGCLFWQEGIKSEVVTVVGPVLPILSLNCGSLCSDSIGNCIPRKQEITRDAIFELTWNSYQERFCGSGKCELKYFTRFSCAWKYSPFLNPLEGISAIALFFPAMCIGRRDDSFLVCWRRESRRNNLPAGIDLDVPHL